MAFQCLGRLARRAQFVVPMNRLTFTTGLPLLLALAPLGVVACSGSSKSSTPDLASAQASIARDAPSQAALGPAVAANNAFAFELYGQVAPTVDGGNLITSPLSASLALTMTYAGAQGQTATEMASVLQLGDAGADSVFAGQNALSQAIAGRAAAALAHDQQNAQGSQEPAPSSSDYAVDVVNSVWGQKTYTWETPFLDTMAKSYGTGIFLEDFANDPGDATNAINAWVSSETADKINNLLPPLTNDIRMVLVNAVHLKLPWASPFLVSATTSGTFTRRDGSTVTASFMNQAFEEASASYNQDAQAQYVTIPLAGNQLSVVFALPKNGLAALFSSLTPETFSAVATPSSQGVLVSLPKFTFTTDRFSLAPALQALGMKTAFDAKLADFKGLCAAPPDGSNLYISDVIQKAMMEVAENGVEAAAATAVLVAGTSAATTPPPSVTFDHPFLVSIVDSSGAIVFLGQIGDPTDAGSN
jgi:serpin B